MTIRFADLASAAVITGLTLSVAAAPAAAQSKSKAPNSQAPGLAFAKEAGTKNWTAPKNPDGTPDLQGYFTNSTVTPLERPRDLGAKEFFTQEEADAYAKKVMAQKEATGPGTYNDVHYDMAQFGLERAQNKVAKTIRTSMILGPEGRVPELLPEAKTRAAARAAANRGHEFDGPENRGLAEQCIIWNNEGPPMMPVGYNSNLQIVQGDGYVAIEQEMIHDTRIIPIDPPNAIRPHLPSDVHMLMGDSRGHYEGNTLVVDTTNFTDRVPFHGSGEKLHVVERFTRTNPDTVLYQFTVDDPTAWAHSWSAEISMTKIDGPIFEYACHEGNYGMRNNLSGARAEEKQKAEAASLKK
jgi:hypothetical protein